MPKPKAVGIKGVCPRCKEEVEFILTKKQVKAIMKGFKANSRSKAELVAEKEGAY